jgi:hypothetical protein
MAQAAVRRNQELEKVLDLIREAVRRLDRNGIRVARAILDARPSPRASAALFTSTARCGSL